MSAIKLAIESRLQYQFAGNSAGGLSKDFLLEIANERNKVALPRLVQNDWGVRLPNEKFILTGVSWGLKDGSWEQEGSDDDDEDEEEEQAADVTMSMDGPAGDDEGMEDADEEGGKMEDIFGPDAGDADNDVEME